MRREFSSRDRTAGTPERDRSFSGRQRRLTVRAIRFLNAPQLAILFSERVKPYWKGYWNDLLH